MAGHWDEVRNAIDEIRGLMLGDDIDVGLDHLSNLVGEAEKRKIGGKVTDTENTTTEVRVTIETLKKAGACSFYRTKFAEEFPDGLVITEEKMVEIYDDWDWDWAAEYLLNKEGREKWLKAADESYEKYNQDLEKLGQARRASGQSHESQEEEREAIRERHEKFLAGEFARLACAGHYEPRKTDTW